MNERCERVLGCNLKQIAYLKRNNMFSVRQKHDHQRDTAVYRIRIQNKEVRLNGHVHYINDPVNNEVNLVFVFSDIRTLQEDLMLNRDIQRFSFKEMPCSSAAFSNTIEQCKKAAYSEHPILLVGESGTGKEMLAHAIHQEGLLRNGLFITTSHSTAVQELLETSVFDPEQIYGNSEEQSNPLAGNTLFVDDVLNLSWEKQRRLLTIIQNGQRIYNQVICGASTNLKEQTEAGNFNPELYYTLEPYSIYVPPLRSRGNDLKLYTDKFLQEANEKYQRNVKISKELVFLEGEPSGIAQLYSAHCEPASSGCF